MIIRISSGVDGIGEYLEYGQKSGRYYSRDELDERVILNGDIETLEAVIKKVDTTGDRYQHITLAFKEDTISNEILGNIAKEFSEYYMSAFKDGEFYCYAEAHLPKIKSYRSKESGEIIERKPHIHVVIPSINLYTGKTINYKRENFLNYFNAFQEYVNHKYGLASPKDNRREFFNGQSECISRYKGDEFVGVRAELRKDIFAKVMDKEINNYDDFIRLLKSEYGEVKLRNANKQATEQYLNVFIEGNARGINLKDYVFRREFIELSQTEKLEYITRENMRKYHVESLPREIPKTELELMNEWTNYKSLEAKYINSGNEKLWEKYQSFTDQERKEYLAQTATTFYTKHGVEYDRTTISDLARVIKQYNEIGERERNSATRNLESASENLRAAGEYKPNIESTSDAVRRTYEADYSDFRQIKRGTGGVQSGEREIGADSRERGARLGSSEYEQIKADFNKDRFYDSRNYTSESEQFKKILSADVLLEIVAKTHGVLPEKYVINKAKDGTDRILCGNRNLNVCDFMTKELNLSWDQAALILRNSLALQRSIDDIQHLDRGRNLGLWDDYRKWSEQYKQNKQLKWNTHKQTARVKRQEINAEYRENLKELEKLHGKYYHKLAEEKRKLKAEKANNIQALNGAVRKEREALMQEYAVNPIQLYKVFLLEKANLGNDKALDELRRLRIDPEEYKNTGQINYVNRYKDYRLNIQHKIDEAGIITYFIDGKEAVRDTGKRIDVIDRNNDNHMQVALNLAVQRFGNKLELSGSDEFKKKAVEFAVANNMRVTFKDQFSESYRQELLQMAAANKIIQKNTQQELSKVVQIKDLCFVSKSEAIIGSDNQFERKMKFNFVDISTGKSIVIIDDNIAEAIKYDGVKCGDLINLSSKQVKNESGEIRQQYFAKIVEPKYLHKLALILNRGVEIHSMDNGQLMFESKVDALKNKYSNIRIMNTDTDRLKSKLKDAYHNEGDFVKLNVSYDKSIMQLKVDVLAVVDSPLKKEIKAKLVEKVKLDSRLAVAARNPVTTSDIERLNTEFIGTVVEHGVGRFGDSVKDSYFIKLQMANGGSKVVWGKQLEKLMSDKNINVGQMIYLAKIKQEPVNNVIRNTYAIHEINVNLNKLAQEQVLKAGQKKGMSI